MLVQLDFKKPIAISPKKKQDVLIWHQKSFEGEEQSLFYSKNLTAYLHKNYTTLNHSIRKQMNPGQA
jgi:hypothetical protein